MTPLLWDIVQTYTLPIKDRDERFAHHEELREHLEGCHSYEVSAIAGSCERIMREGHSPNGVFTFAPGERVWLEYKKLDGVRNGILISGAMVYTYHSLPPGHKFDDEGNEVLAEGGFANLAFEAQMSAISAYAEKDLPWENEKDEITDIGLFRFIRAAFSIINRPQHVGLKVNQPHKGRLKKLVGTGFPLRVWHEVTVGAKTRDHGGQQIESGISGTMPYHHVRAHYKPSLGIVIPEHWRGDPSIGIKQTRYRVEKPK